MKARPKKKKVAGMKLCPSCNGEYFEPPALSREDNKTYVCPSCGIREALAALATFRRALNGDRT